MLKSLAIRLFRITLLLSLLTLSWPGELAARIERVRASWRSDPSTTMVIGWDQVSGGRPAIFYDLVDHGDNRAAYAFRQPPSWANRTHGMNNVFVRLEGLRPNTVYYFLITDTEGSSRRYTFKTAPNNPQERLSIIAGSDSRNNRAARCDANRLVSKLRPHFVMFGGDMTDTGSDQEWRDWFDDWQLSIGSDGRLFPIVVARGNHETHNDVLVNLFDVPSKDVFYGLSFGGDLLRVYTLNTQFPGGGVQRDWLGRDLQAHQHMTWRIAQYHQAIEPHTARKQSRKELVQQWAVLFHRFKVQAVIESDAHVVKTTWPIRPGAGPGSAADFVRDDSDGTVYMGEGGWGAPLRPADDPKPWTRSYGSFNQFRWLFVDQYRIEARTIKTQGSSQVAEVDPAKPFTPPLGLAIWQPQEGAVVTIYNTEAGAPPPVAVSDPTVPVPPVPISPDAAGKVKLDYQLGSNSFVQLILLNNANREMARLEYENQPPGAQRKSIDLSKAPAGRYLLIIKANQQLIKRYAVTIP
jgi:hypothetical protein